MSQSAVEDAMKIVNNVVFSKSVAESQDAYSSWCQVYDEDNVHTGYKPLQEVGEMFKKHVKKLTSLLDIGTGTGKMVEYIRKEGYTCLVDVLDANMEMLIKAHKKNLNIRTVIQHFVSKDGILPLKDEFYDVVSCAGSFAPNHIPPTALKGMINVLKKGGLLIFTTRSKTAESYKAQIDATIRELLDENKIELVESKEFVHYVNTSSGLTSMVYVLKKL